MRGSIVKRSRTSWELVVDQGRDSTGKRRQKWVTFAVPRNVSQREAHKQADAKLAELLHQIDKGIFVDASKTTLVEYLRDWHQTNVVPHRLPETARIYASMIEQHVATAPIASMPLQKVRASGLERLYSTVKLAPSSVTVLHAVIGRALKIAVRDKLLVANPASAVEDRPRPSRDTSLAARAHCWTVDEVRRVRAAAKEGGPQVSAFMALLLDAGCRKSEALGLIWSDVDLDAGTVTIAGQLEPRCSERLAWGPTKTASRRTSWRGVSDTRRSARRSKPTPTRRLTCRSTPPA